ncbi:BadF/BadG/BcrA/BcrD ATPase family protein [Dactylosporangium siamense]|uniref:N-acetylglucosamine kinase n=1 Tax=Dactylosporangium siamense TaxID=685454 RepID=A0A919U9D7_9ACTN|nr:N-acetylglucosamine kinase [Dactylosporangium siamense]
MQYGVRVRTPLVVGVDAGATSTRCLVSAIDGTVLGRGHAAGANQNSSGGRPAEALAGALRMALDGLDPADVALGVIGAAGAAAAGAAEARQAAEEAWHATGLRGALHSVTDLEVAFSAGTSHRQGLLLLAGTGAAAVAFRDGVPFVRCDGYGWLLGDEGSAVWQGREALRAVLCALDGRGPATLLTGPVTAALDVDAQDDPEGHAQALVRVAYRRPPAALGLLAPLVGAAAGAGDEVARGIAAAAAGHLLHALDVVARRAGRPDGSPVVLAGSVLLTAGPVAALVRTGIQERFGAGPAEARDGAAGAAALAVAALTGSPVGAAVHARLTVTR